MWFNYFAQMTNEEVLWHSFKKLYHEDHANAAMHCAPVRYSPLTFRLAEAVERATKATVDWDTYPEVYAVLLDRGLYREDPGRE